MSAVVEHEQAVLPPSVARRNITEYQWRTLMNNLFPGASGESVLMVWDYCLARKLDPLKKPCHIVPMQVRNQAGDYIWRDVVMPGIYEYRTTATRTGLYLGHSVPEYGEVIEHLSRKVPASCSITVYRWNVEAKQRAEYPVTLWFEEVCATRKDKKDKEKIILNDRWNKAPRQMLTKCVEAAALREAFPDELGGTHTADEMEGQRAEEAARSNINPRGDVSAVDHELRDRWVRDFTDVLAQPIEEWEIATQLRALDIEVSKFPELAIVVSDRLAEEGIISKAKYKAYLNVQPLSET